MSFLQPFNYSFSPFPASTSGFSPAGLPGGFNDGNAIGQQQQQQQLDQYYVPESIASSHDYYGNPTAPQAPQQQQAANHAQQQQQFQQNQFYQQQQQLQQAQQQPAFNPLAAGTGTGRKRRPKNGRTRSVGLLHPGLGHDLRVTPIQGPIYAKDGFVPVVPLYSYPSVNNGTFYQIPILWTALSYALGLEIRGEIIRGLPCIKRLNQLFCPTAGTTYPTDRIERFIDENKALIKRMYGEFAMNSPESLGGASIGNNLRRSAREVFEHEIPNLFANHRDTVSKPQSSGNTTAHPRYPRQTVNPKNGAPTQHPKSNRVDSCESTTEIVTPYWAANSAGKVRAIVNTQHFEQAIHQEVCAKTSTKRCTGDCACEQKYKWHRLLAYEPDNDCKGIFMDWFLFPSCCVCRCNPTT